MCFSTWKDPTNHSPIFYKLPFSKLPSVQNTLLRPNFSYPQSHQISSFWSVVQRDGIKTKERTLKPFHKGFKSAQQQDSLQMGQQEANKKVDTYQPTR